MSTETLRDDLIRLLDSLAIWPVSDLSHQDRKTLFLQLQDLKTLARQHLRSAVLDELIAMEQSLGFGQGDAFVVSDQQMLEHRQRLEQLLASPSLEASEESGVPDIEDSHEETSEAFASEVFYDQPDEPLVYDDQHETYAEPDEIETDTAADEIDNLEPNEDWPTDYQQTDKEAVDYDATPTQQGILLCLCNCSSRDEARDLARSLVEERLAACVNIIANIGAIYRWQGEIHDTAECQLQIKTTSVLQQAVEDHIKAKHSNEVPEIIFTTIHQGNQDYFAWVAEETIQS